jgi:hypothetical protein
VVVGLHPNANHLVRMTGHNLLRCSLRTTGDSKKLPRLPRAISASPMGNQ